MTIRSNTNESHGETGAASDAARISKTRRRSTILRRILVGTFLFAMLAAPTAGSVRADELTSGTGSRNAKEQAIASIPFAQLNRQTRDKINPVIDKPSIYRRLPVTAVNVDAEYFVFLARYPEVVVNIWKLMGITQMATTRTSEYTMNTDDGSGTISDMELVYGTRNLHIFYGTGSYTGPVLKRELTGKAVLVLRTEYTTGPQGEPVATSQLDVFLKVDNATAGLVARTLNPLVGTTADHNFTESLNFIQRLNETTVDNGPGVQQMAGRLTDINTDVRQQFIQVAGEVYQRAGGAASSATMQQSGQPQRPQGYPNANYPSRNYSQNQPVMNRQRTNQQGMRTPAQAYPSQYYPATGASYSGSGAEGYSNQYRAQPAGGANPGFGQLDRGQLNRGQMSYRTASGVAPASYQSRNAPLPQNGYAAPHTASTAGYNTGQPYAQPNYGNQTCGNQQVYGNQAPDMPARSYRAPQYPGQNVYRR